LLILFSIFIAHFFGLSHILGKLDKTSNQVKKIILCLFCLGFMLSELNFML